MPSPKTIAAANEKAAFIEEYLDDCLRRNRKPDADKLKPGIRFREQKLTRPQANILHREYAAMLQSWEADFALWNRTRLEGDDDIWDQARENFAGWDAEKFEARIEFYAKIVKALNPFTVAPPKKQKPQEMQAAKFKHGKSDPSLGLRGKEPHIVMQAQELWVWNTKTRKLGAYVAADKRGLSFKDGKIAGFDREKSVQKMAKPAEVRNKRNWGKVMEGLVGMATQLDGKGSEKVLLLAAK